MQSANWTGWSGSTRPSCAHQHAAGERSQNGVGTATRPSVRMLPPRADHQRADHQRFIWPPAGAAGRCALSLPPGQRHESTQFGVVLDGIRLAGRRGQPRAGAGHRRKGLQLRAGVGDSGGRRIRQVQGSNAGYPWGGSVRCRRPLTADSLADSRPTGQLSAAVDMRKVLKVVDTCSLAVGAWT